MKLNFLKSPCLKANILNTHSIYDELIEDIGKFSRDFGEKITKNLRKNYKKLVMATLLGVTGVANNGCGNTSDVIHATEASDPKICNPKIDPETGCNMNFWDEESYEPVVELNSDSPDFGKEIKWEYEPPNDFEMQHLPFLGHKKLNDFENIAEFSCDFLPDHSKIPKEIYNNLVQKLIDYDFLVEDLNLDSFKLFGIGYVFLDSYDTPQYVDKFGIREITEESYENFIKTGLNIKLINGDNLSKKDNEIIYKLKNNKTKKLEIEFKNHRQIIVKEIFDDNSWQQTFYYAQKNTTRIHSDKQRTANNIYDVNDNFGYEISLDEISFNDIQLFIKSKKPDSLGFPNEYSSENEYLNLVKNLTSDEFEAFYKVFAKDFKYKGFNNNLIKKIEVLADNKLGIEALKQEIETNFNVPISINISEVSQKTKIKKCLIKIKQQLSFLGKNMIKSMQMPKINITRMNSNIGLFDHGSKIISLDLIGFNESLGTLIHEFVHFADNFVKKLNKGTNNMSTDDDYALINLSESQSQNFGHPAYYENIPTNYAATSPNEFSAEILRRLYYDYNNYMQEALELAEKGKMGMLNSINAMKNFLYKISRGQFNQETWDKHKFMSIF